MMVYKKKKPLVVLISEDLETFTFVKKALGASYSLRMVKGIEAAISLLDRHQPSLLLSDIMQPVSSWGKLTEKLRDNNSTSNVPIVWLSSTNIRKPRRGVDDYLVKPFTSTELQVKVNANFKIARYRQAAEQNLHHTFMQSPFAITIYRGPNFIVELANAATLKMWRRTSAQVLNRPLFEAVPELVEQGFNKILHRVYATGKPFRSNENAVKIFKENKLQDTYINYIYEPLRGFNGEIMGVIGVGFDMTHQVTSRKKVEESEQRLNMALDYTNTASFDMDLQTYKIIYSSKLPMIFGYSSAENLSPKRISKVIYPEDRPTIKEAFREALKEGHFQRETRILWTDHSLHWVNIQGRVTYDDNGYPKRMLGTIKDITHEKGEQQRKDEFMGIVTHELRTPVTSLKAFAQYLFDRFEKAGDQEAARLLSKMDQQINKLNILIQDLLDVTKLEGGKMQFHAVPYCFNELLHEVVEEMQRTTTKSIEIIEMPQQVYVKGDKDRTGQVLINLLSNAIKYSPNAEKIQVLNEARNDKIICGVKDFGIGIPKEKQKNLFERFYRVADSHSDTFPGLGLGLYISSEIIKHQKGHMWVESDKGEGSTFYFSLPCF